LIVGAWFHPSFDRASKGASASDSPPIIAADLPAATPITLPPTPSLPDDVTPLPDAQPRATPDPRDSPGSSADPASDASTPSPDGVLPLSTVSSSDDTQTPTASNGEPLGPVHLGGGVPILMYHYIRINPVATDRAGFVLSVTPGDFARQMQFLATQGFTTVTMEQVRNYVRYDRPLPSKPIAITFDDGYDDAYSQALPVLQQYHQTATFYIITGFVGLVHYLTWNQVMALNNAGMEIGSHTVHHSSLPLLSGLLRRTELLDSQQTLEDRLGHPVLDFCYPGGQLDAATEIAVKQTGYLSATTTQYGYANVGDDPLRLPRVRVSGGESLTEFAKLIGERVTSAPSSRASTSTLAGTRTPTPATPTARPVVTGTVTPPPRPTAKARG
jgi:peptidoglycan/xylan/chitin deacetylase (PgdA/CDA1 family)